MNDTEEYILDTEFIFNSGTKIYRNIIRRHKFNLLYYFKKYHERYFKLKQIFFQFVYQN